MLSIHCAQPCARGAGDTLSSRGHTRKDSPSPREGGPGVSRTGTAEPTGRWRVSSLSREPKRSELVAPRLKVLGRTPQRRRGVGVPAALSAAVARRLRGQQLDRGRHAGEEAPAPAPDAGPRGLPESPKEQVPVRFWPHHRLSPSWPLPPTPSCLQIQPPPPPGTEGRPKPPSSPFPPSLGVRRSSRKEGTHRPSG